MCSHEKNVSIVQLKISLNFESSSTGDWKGAVMNWG